MRGYSERRAALIAEAAPGQQASRELSDLSDEAVRELSRAADSAISGRWAIIALGSWGRGSLMPTSDLDVLILTDERASGVKPFAESLLYPLWDAGLSVGHQVRSPREQLRAMRADTATCTAALTGRAIAGDAEWAAEALSTWAADARRRRRTLLTALSRRPRPGSAFALSADLKNDEGGRRDHDELVWRASILSGAPASDASALVDAGLLSHDEFMLLDGAASVLDIARWELAAGGAGSRLTEESVELLHAVNGEDVAGALATAAGLLSRVRERGTRAQRSAAATTAAAQMTADQLFDRLAMGDSTLADLEQLAFSGAFDSIVPGFSGLMTTRRPGLGHRFTVGAHCLRAATAVPSLTTGSGVLGASYRSMSDLHTTLLAALVHDIGKADETAASHSADHAERGAEPARQAALAAGLGEQRADEVAALVRHHLLLAEVSMRSNLDDEDAILACAARLGDPGLLAPLHVLTYADSVATAPEMWSPWREALVATLVTRLEAAFSNSVDGVGLIRCAESVRTEALAATGPFSAKRAFVESAPIRYLASKTPAEVLDHANLVIGLSMDRSGEPARFSVKAGAVEGTCVVTVAAVDRPYLLARLAGAFSLAGLDILSVDAHAVVGGVALDTFAVTSSTAADITPETFSRLDRLMNAALKDRLQLATRLAERRRHYAQTGSRPVVVTSSDEGWTTRIDVVAADRVGLLHDLATAVADCGLDIRWASAQTVDGAAHDTFHVTGPDGGPVTDPGELGHLAMRFREVD